MPTQSGPEDFTRHASDAAETMRDQARSFGDTASSLADNARRAAGPAVDAARDRARRFTKEAQDVAEDAYRYGEEAAGGVMRRLEEQPLLGALLAFGLGCLAGYMLGRRS
jgi:hypothetical protein